MTDAGQKKGDHPDRLVASFLSGILPNCCFQTQEPLLGPAPATASFPSFLHAQAFLPNAHLLVPFLVACYSMDTDYASYTRNTSAYL